MQTTSNRILLFLPIKFFWKAKNHDDKSMNVILINQAFLFTCLIALLVRVLIYIQLMNCFVNFNYGLTDEGLYSFRFF